MTYQFYDLCSFADVIFAVDKDCFLEALKQHLKKALLIYEDDSDSEEQRCLDFKLTLLMVRFAVDGRLLEQKQDDLRVYEKNKRFWRRLFQRSFWRKYIIFPGERPDLFHEETPNLKVSVKEMIVLASTVYFQKGWGCCDDLKRELEHMA